MPEVLAIIPARTGSKGIPGKNFKSLVGASPVERAAQCALACGLHTVITTDMPGLVVGGCYTLHAEAPLHTDTCPMIDVIMDVVTRIPGPPDQMIVLVQPTQPLRRPEHLRAAIELLESTGADSVVSVIELPLDLSPDFLGIVTNGRLRPWNGENWPTRRQACTPAVKRDGTVYTFRRRNLWNADSFYGNDVRALVIPPEETCPLDTRADWAEAERRLSL